MTRSCPQSHSNALNVKNILELSTLFHFFQKQQQQLLQEQQQQYYKNENNEHDEEDIDKTNRINHDEDFFCEWKHCVKSVQIRSFFQFVFPRIRPGWWKIRNRKNSVFGNFSRSGSRQLLEIIQSNSQMREYPCIWNTSLRSHHNKTILKNILDELSNKFGFQVRNIICSECFIFNDVNNTLHYLVEIVWNFQLNAHTDFHHIVGFLN